jgi:hypothetical protein
VAETDYRRLAKRHVCCAKMALSKDDSHLGYAALDLRMAIEAVCYDRASAYSKELPDAVYRMWQPRKLMNFLISLDPLADKRREFRYAINDEHGNPIEPVRSLGMDQPLKLSEIRDHYDALGSYLHVPTLAQMKDGKQHDLAALRARCSTLVGILEAVLTSKIWNAVFGQFLTADCVRCEKIMKVRFDNNPPEFDYSCIHCSAPYKVRKIDGEDRYQFCPDYEYARCAHSGCDAKFSLWRDEIAVGTILHCTKCENESEIMLCVSPKLTTSI